MFRTIKHIAIVALCLLVICGAVGTHFYVFVCSHNHHAAQLSFTNEHHACCEHDHSDGDNHRHDDSVPTLDDANSCCKITSQVLSVSSFETSQVSKLNKIAPLAILFDALLHSCDSACSHTAAIAYPPSVNSPQSPDIYSFGQLRL